MTRNKAAASTKIKSADKFRIAEQLQERGRLTIYSRHDAGATASLQRTRFAKAASGLKAKPPEVLPPMATIAEMKKRAQRLTR